MRYLAEIQKQSKGFMGGFETKLKLLASQDSDRGWNTVTGKELINIEDTGNLGDGALVIVTLNSNHQVQGTLEPASARILGILQSFSRLLEKSKNQEEEIETWKESLTIQSEQLSARELEMETRLEQLERMEEEFHQFDAQRQEIAAAKAEAERLKSELDAQSQQLAQEQEQLNQQQQRLEQNLKEGKFLDEAQAEEIQNLLQSLSVEINSFESVAEPLKLALKKFDQVLIATKLDKEKQILAQKQELLAVLVEQEQSHSLIQDALNRAGIESSGNTSDNKIDLVALENMPLSELENIVATMHKDLEKVAKFVQDQEEELSWQCKAVEELEQKIKEASEFDRLALEHELAEEKEAKKMLDETLVGQRRSLKERHEVFLQHSRILKRRQGVFDLEIELQDIDLEPIKNAVEKQRETIVGQKATLESEIVVIQQNIQNLAAKLPEPINLEETLNQIKQDLDKINSLLIKEKSTENKPNQVLTEIDRMIKELVSS